MTSKTFSSGREASMARRRALSQGKAGLPPAKERVRSGFRDAAMPASPAAPAPAPAASAPVAPAADVPQAVAPAPSTKTPAQSGREASMARRRALSQGKAGLPAAKERVRSGFRDAAMPETPAGVAQAAAPDRPVAPAAETVTASDAAPLPSVADENSTRELVRKRRMIRAKYGRGEAQPTRPSRPPRKGELNYPEKVPAVSTAVSNATVTGISYAKGRAVTGAEAGHDKPLTGTQYVTGQEGAYRAGLGKVGKARTHGGLTVSGTMVRSTVQITGDEENGNITVTGNAEQTLADDLTPRPESFVPVASQFQRQAQPHGQSVHGTNLGRSVQSMGSRSRDTERASEQTQGGHAVSGTAIGRSIRVTGDESGAARSLTGTQYLAPAAAQAAQASAKDRPDPVTGRKVSHSQTWGGQSVTGPEMEHDGVVTGSEAGTCATLTGTPYYGATAAHGWCDPAAAETQENKTAPRAPRAITGDVPLNDPNVSGTGRGADRAITGSAYFVSGEAAPQDAEGDRVASSITGFSVNSPQRQAHLQSRASAPAEAAPADDGKITGTFAQGEGKVTGNVEFAVNVGGRRQSGRPGHGSITGEGAMRGPGITGSAWDDNPRVTGTEGYIAESRNPTQRGGDAKTFAGASRFKSQASTHDQTSQVTGAVGWTPPTGAKVTLSGGAAG